MRKPPIQKPVIKLFRTAVTLNTQWKHVLFPLVVLTLYFVSFSWFLSWLLPGYSANVNAVFVNGAWKFSLLLLLAAGSYLAFFVLFNRNNENKLTFKNSIEKLSVSDFFLILLPLTPVVQYILNNQDILSPLGSLYVLAVFMIFSVIFIIVTPTLLGIVGSTKTLMILGLAFTFTITNMALLSAEFHWAKAGSLMIQVALFSATFLISWTLYNLIDRKFLYFAVAIFFIANSAIQLVPNDRVKTELSSNDNKLVELVGSKKPLSTPNIYLLVYDGYVINETMLEYGIDNSAQEKYLETLDFKLYPHTYSVGAASIGTMSRVLNASTEYYGSTRRGISGDGITQNLLKSFGYETYGIFSSYYFFEGIGSSYDFSFPNPKASSFAYSAHKLLLKAIFMGEFRFDLQFGTPSHEQFIEYKSSIFESVPNKSRVIYMQTDVPMHSQNSGACRPNETELFRERLIVANDEMKKDIETITRKDPGAIIVVAGDHGPYLTKNCTSTGDQYDISEMSRLDIQDRFGTFLAIKWPSENFSKYDDITILQDLFPAIFAYLFGDDKLLEAKVAPTTLEDWRASGASVKNGIINGGINDGEPLFVGRTGLEPVAP